MDGISNPPFRIGVSDMEEIKRCWEFKACGREPGGTNAEREGVCDAARLDSTACWITAGPQSADVEGRCTAVLEGQDCEECDYYRYFMRESLAELEQAEEEEERPPECWSRAIG